MDKRKQARLQGRYETLRLRNVKARREHKDELRAIEADPTRNSNVLRSLADKLEEVHRELLAVANALALDPSYTAHLEPLERRFR